MQIGAGGIRPTASLDLGKGRSAGTDVSHVESNLKAGRTASVTTPDALTLRGATLSGEGVKVGAGSLTIESEQNSSTYSSRQQNIGLSASVQGGSGSIAGNLSTAKQSGSFTSVAEQSGIFAGKDGFNIKVAGNTGLAGGVIACSSRRLETA